MSKYRAFFRRLIRLPLDSTLLELARIKARAKCAQSFRPALYNRIIDTMDAILVHEQYKHFDVLLDHIYKSEPAWGTRLRNTKYTSLRDAWPQTHLIDAFGDPHSCKRYHAELERPQTFLIAAAMQLEDDPEYPLLSPLPSKFTQTDNSGILAELFKLHKFLSENSSLLDLRIQPLEIYYEPNKYGLPQSVASREYILRTKVNYAKTLAVSFRPVDQTHLQDLIAFATNRSDAVINPNFYRYMLRKHRKESVDLQVKKHVRQKQLIPNDRSIRFYYRQYVVRQFYVDSNGNYTMTPMTNLYN